MTLRFYYYYNENFKQWLPAIDEKDFLNERALCGYLCELADNLDFAYEIIEKLDANKFFEIDFSSNYWGVDFIGRGFKIYFLLDENNLEWQTTVAKPIFRKVIFEWLNFLKLSPNEETEKIIQLN